MSQSPKSMIGPALEELVMASALLATASAEVERARREETTCLNRVNEAQKRIDELVASLKKAAPWSSEWKRTKGGEAAP